MSSVSITSVKVLDNPAPFTAPFRFEVSYESLAALEDDLEWRLVYVGSGGDDSYDQVLESVFVGPVVPGVFRFVLEADPPQLDKIPREDVLGATVAFLSCCYRDQEFVRVGYYVSNEIPGLQPPQAEGEGVGEGEGEGEGEGPSAEAVVPPLPENVVPSEIMRNICADEPRVTKFAIKWDNAGPAAQEQAQEQAQGGEAGATVSADGGASANGFPATEGAARIEGALVGEAAS